MTLTSLTTRLRILTPHILRRHASAAAAASARWVPIMHSERQNMLRSPHADMKIVSEEDAADAVTLEQRMRGHSSMIPGSMVYKSVSTRIRLDCAGVDSIEELNELIDKNYGSDRLTDVMYELLMDESRAAAEKRNGLLVTVEELSDESGTEETGEAELDINDDVEVQKEGQSLISKLLSKSGLIDDDEEVESAEMKAQRELIELGIAFANPGCTGPSVAMYDLVLDALSMSKKEGSLKKARKLQMELLDRYKAMSTAVEYFKKKRDAKARERKVKSEEADEEDRASVMIHSVNLQIIEPTAVSFNAVIRTAVNVMYDNKDERVRDEALTAAFHSLYLIHDSACVHRNSATFTYMFQVLSKFIPESRSRGNIARGLFEKACEDGVVNEALLQALSNAGGGMDFDNWLPSILGRSYADMPQKWRQNVKMRSYRHSSGIY